MPERTVQQTLATYIDPDGVRRYALQGETVTVHPDHLKDFDKLNAGPDTPPPKRRGRPPKT